MSVYPDIKSILREKGIEYVGMSHRARRHLLKKEKRRVRRQAAAKRRSELCEKTSVLSKSVRCLDSTLSCLREEESKLQQYCWLARESEFLSKIDKKRNKKDEVERCEETRTVSADRDRIREPHLGTPPVLTHLPFSPLTADVVSDTGSSSSSKECYFFLKTGACKFGDSCNRVHPHPSLSRSLVFPHLFSGTGVTTCMVDGRERDVVRLENDPTEVYQRFCDFYEDVYPEIVEAAGGKGKGEVVRFEVCANEEWHLRGNVFVQFRTPEAAVRCRQAVNGRWYDRRQVNCEFSCVQDFGLAICQVETAGKLSQSKKYKVCLKGKNCNFWHVFRKDD